MGDGGNVSESWDIIFAYNFQDISEFVKKYSKWRKYFLKWVKNVVKKLEKGPVKAHFKKMAKQINSKELADGSFPKFLEENFSDFDFYCVQECAGDAAEGENIIVPCFWEGGVTPCLYFCKAGLVGENV